MSPPDKAAAQTSGKPAENSEPTFADQVNGVTDQLVLNEAKNVWELPEGVEASEQVLYTATVERRRRDAQSSRSKLNNELQVTKAENSVLRDKVTGDARVELSDEQEAELQELKVSDPDAWRVQMNKLEQEASTKRQEELKGISNSASQVGELERRKDVLAIFQDENPELKITDDTIANDVPPRIAKQLEEGKISFEVFLGQVKEYMTNGKVLDTGDDLENQASLSSVGGRQTASDEAVEGSIVESYEQDTY